MPELAGEEMTTGHLILGLWSGILILTGLAAWLHALVHRKWVVTTKGPPPQWRPSVVDFALLGIVVFVAVGLVGPLVAMEIMNLLPEDENGANDWAFLVQSLSMQGAILGLLLLFFLVQRQTFKTTGGGPSGGLRHSLKWGLYGFVLALPLVSVSSFVTMFLFRQLGWDFQLQETVEEIANVESTLLFLLMPLPVVILAPLWEEIVFRAGLFRYLKNLVPVLAAGLLSAACFSLIHMQPAQFGGLFVMGCMLALVYQKSGSLWAPICLHAIFNANTMLAIFFMRFG